MGKSEESLSALAREALDKLGVETVPTTYERLYNEGKSTQVPTGWVYEYTKRQKIKDPDGALALWAGRYNAVVEANGHIQTIDTEIP